MANSAGNTATGSGEFYYPGPVAMAYERDFSHRKVFLDGPTGGGKTFSSARKCLNATLVQKPSTKDGVRRAKIVVVCPSYQIMEDTVVSSFKKVHNVTGKGWSWDGSPRRQQTATFKGQFQNGIKAQMRVDFRAVTDLDYDTFFRGLECTAFWTPEADTVLNREIMGYFANRYGREYLDHVPDGEKLSWYGLFGDSNVPFVDTYFHELFYLKLDEDEQARMSLGGMKCWHQPAGYDPDQADGWNRDAQGNIIAENYRMLSRQSDKYYLEKAHDMDDEKMAKRLLSCKPMPQRFGLPVHDAFDAEFHLAALPLRPRRDKRVIIGIDGTGLCPAAVFFQREDWGQWRAIKEFAPLTHEYDSVDFGQNIRRILEEDFDGAPGGVIGCYDPANDRRAQGDKRFFEWQIIQRAAGMIPMLKAPSNEHKVRKTALDRPLKSPGMRRDGRNEAMLLISRQGCPNFIRGLAGGYAYKKRKEEVSEEVDKKNPLTNVVEAGQYALLTIEGIDGVGRKFSVHGENRPAQSAVQVTRKQRAA